MNYSIENILELAGDMQHFRHEYDKLDDLVGELSEWELDYVAAAAASPELSYQKFTQMLQSRKSPNSSET